MKKLIAVIAVAFWLVGCGVEPDKNLPLNEYAKTVAGERAQVNAIEQIGDDGKPNKTFFVEITVASPDTFWGGAQDWNSFSSKVSYIGQHLLERQDVARVRIESDTTASDGKPIGWAYADIEKKKLPQNFNSFTYLEFSSFANFSAGTAQANGWLCEFYKKYDSARPGGKLPFGC